MDSTILIVEDERDINFILRTHFKKEGYRVLTASTAETGLALTHKHKPDLILLDIMLPKMDGLEMMQSLRQKSQAPVVFLTAKKDEIDRVLGLKIGAEDYVTKPFSLKELDHRVKAILRRASNQAAVPTAAPCRIGGLSIDFERHEVEVQGKPIELSPREFQLLQLLVEADGKTLSRDDLATKIWGEDKGLEIDVRTVDQHIARLRRKLGAERERIVTVSNFGYKIHFSEKKHGNGGKGRG